MSYIQPTICALLMSGVCLSANARADSLNIEIVNKLVSIEAVNISLIAVAERLSEVIDIPVSYTDGMDQKITVSISEEPLETAVAKLVENNLFVTRTVNGEEVLAEIVFLLPDNQTGYSEANLPTGAPADEVVADAESPELAEQPYVEEAQTPIETESEPLPSTEATQ